ncbi:DUF4167 domain-containing protein [Phyllobacterium sp. 21LDTY02-6]|jgi:hypothetical protein|uniref:DUF4167 domain-containing protein n=1 Tax=unclassified Phyllobacterium TaxID=2638441 RepID=UPI002020A901|nr:MULTISPECIES: DUF4167 domain-containing protein [unclassified Phyllobacterium]MCO4319238.1 DUF4167 domain-containing protein [Phyllobacterium sp. 21LDTY02-6]MCX8279999.1 DUF4167 domain-containing protein [Phyllobacterium sp. 0TCS1.6C]MCX8296166.1 DUF4167 domain-containing protein [Phyllobacterium sp. 0TCS1.6A]
MKNRQTRTPRQSDNRSNDDNARRNYEKYLAQAEQQVVAGNHSEAENLYQHAEHYFRRMNRSSANNDTAG